MATVFVIAGSVIGFWIAMAALVLGSGLAVAMALWIGCGLLATVLHIALVTVKPREQHDALTQSA